MKNKLKRWRVTINKSWTKIILFKKNYYFEKSARAKFEKLVKLNNGNKNKVITLYKL